MVSETIDPNYRPISPLFIDQYQGHLQYRPGCTTLWVWLIHSFSSVIKIFLQYYSIEDTLCEWIIHKNQPHVCKILGRPRPWSCRSPWQCPLGATCTCKCVFSRFNNYVFKKNRNYKSSTECVHINYRAVEFMLLIYFHLIISMFGRNIQIFKI